MGLLSSIGKAVTKVLDTNQAIFSSPITTLTKGINAGIAETKSKSLKENVTSIGINTAIATGAVLTSGTSAGRAAAVTVAKAVAPKTGVGIVATGAAGLAGVGLITSSSKARESVLSAPSSLVSFGSNIGEFIDDPSLTKAKEIVTENPIVSGLAGAAVVGATAGLAVPIISGALTREKIEDVEQAIESIDITSRVQPVLTPVATQPTPISMPTAQEAAVVTSNPTIPILPEDKVVSKAKRRTTKRKPAPTIINRNINKLVAVIR